MYAAAEGNAESVEIMIANGANLEAEDEVGAWMITIFTVRNCLNRIFTGK